MEGAHKDQIQLRWIFCCQLVRTWTSASLAPVEHWLFAMWCVCFAPDSPLCSVLPLLVWIVWVVLLGRVFLFPGISEGCASKAVICSFLSSVVFYCLWLFSPSVGDRKSHWCHTCEAVRVACWSAGPWPGGSGACLPVDASRITPDTFCFLFCSLCARDHGLSLLVFLLLNLPGNQLVARSKACMWPCVCVLSRALE